MIQQLQTLESTNGRNPKEPPADVEAIWIIENRNRFWQQWNNYRKTKRALENRSIITK
jgi:hypothetical protein